MFFITLFNQQIEQIQFDPEQLYFATTAIDKVNDKTGNFPF
jgi:hypothetical protein